MLQESQNPLGTPNYVFTDNALKSPSRGASPQENQKIGGMDIQCTENCQGCFVQGATLFCEECDKYLCQLCSDQIHLIPSFSQHKRYPISSLNL